ncbi:MAG: response regulator transcription factor, partial [Candidatus Omnitrophota bacterium]
MSHRMVFGVASNKGQNYNGGEDYPKRKNNRHIISHIVSFYSSSIYPVLKAITDRITPIIKGIKVKSLVKLLPITKTARNNWAILKENLERLAFRFSDNLSDILLINIPDVLGFVKSDFQSSSPLLSRISQLLVLLSFLTVFTVNAQNKSETYPYPQTDNNISTILTEQGYSADKFASSAEGRVEAKPASSPAALVHQILIVDDSPDMLVTVKGYLNDEFNRETTTLQISTATGVKEALQVLNAQSITLVITDQGIPFNGVNLITKLNEFWPQIRVIAMSGEWKRLKEVAGSPNVLRAVWKGSDFCDEIVSAVKDFLFHNDVRSETGSSPAGFLKGLYRLFAGDINGKLRHLYRYFVENFFFVSGLLSFGAAVQDLKAALNSVFDVFSDFFKRPALAYATGNGRTFGKEPIVRLFYNYLENHFLLLGYGISIEGKALFVNAISGPTSSPAASNDLTTRGVEVLRPAASNDLTTRGVEASSPDGEASEIPAAESLRASLPAVIVPQRA